MPRNLKATQAVTRGEMPIKDLNALELMSYEIPSTPRTNGEHRLGWCICPYMQVPKGKEKDEREREWMIK